MARPSKRRRRNPCVELLLAASVAPTAFGFNLGLGGLPKAASDAMLPLAVLSRPTHSRNTSHTHDTSFLQTPILANASEAVSDGRYGHSALYVNTSNTLLFVGGQVGLNGTAITSSVLSFSLGLPLIWGPMSNSTKSTQRNPSTFANDLSPIAWAASVVDNDETAWLIGGVTESCDNSSLVNSLAFDSATWNSPVRGGHRPPRRRQAAAVPVFNLTTHMSDLYVFGGIADAFTCSGDTLAYVGVDRWSTLDASVESFVWKQPAGRDVSNASSWSPPVSDYTASLLADKTTVAIVGGQAASGELLSMDSALIFNTETRDWQRKNISGSIPEARMGHTAVSLPSGAVWIYGGLSANLTPLATSYLLTPPKNLSAFSTGSWKWTSLSVSNLSLPVPARAWHSATLVLRDSIVVAFGIDETGIPSNEIAFVAVDEKTKEVSWSDSYRPSKLLIRATVENPKAHQMSSLSASPKSTAPSVRESTKARKTRTTVSEALSSSLGSSHVTPYSSTQVAITSATQPPTLIPYTSTSSSHSSSISSSTSASANGTAFAATSAATAQKTVSIAAGVGSAVAVACLVAGIFFAYNRRKQRDFVGGVVLKDDRDTSSLHGGPLVSTLLYTRPVVRRVLSLGSTMSIRTPMTPSSYTGQTSTIGHSVDPFSDSHLVDEMGQLASRDEGGSVGSQSVRSVPFLRSLRPSSPETFLPSPSPSDDAKRVNVPDRYTPIPTLRHIREARMAPPVAPDDWDLFSDLGTTSTLNGDAGGVSRSTSFASTMASSVAGYWRPATILEEPPVPPIPAKHRVDAAPLRVINADEEGH